MVGRVSAPRKAPGPGVSVVRLLAGAAVTGVIAGVLLERSRTVPEAMKQVETAADRAMPTGAAVRLVAPDLMAPDPVSLRGIPPYPGSSPRKLLGAKPGRGLNAISWFSTADSLDRVLSYYEGVYSRSSVFYVKQRWGNNRGYVSWFESTAPRDDAGLRDTTLGVLHMVAASQEGGQTMVFLTATEPDKLLPDTPVLPLGVRLPPGGAPQVLDMGEFGQQRATVYAQYGGTGRDAIADQLVSVMRDSGWTVEERAQAPDGRISVVARQGQRVQIGVVEGTDEHSQILITVEEQPGLNHKGETQ